MVFIRGAKGELPATIVSALWLSDLVEVPYEYCRSFENEFFDASLQCLTMVLDWVMAFVNEPVIWSSDEEWLVKTRRQVSFYSS